VMYHQTSPRLSPRKLVLWIGGVSSNCIALFALVGCVSTIGPQPPNIPTPSEVRVQLESLDKLENGSSSTLGSVTAVQVATAGYTLVDTQCDAFFSAVNKWTTDTSFNRKEITLAGAAAAGVLAAVKATATAIAVTAIGFGLAADSL